MTTYIAYPKDSGVALVIPSGELPLSEVARKDVPANTPFVFIQSASLPDLTFFDAFECDFSNPDGYGIGHEAWEQEQIQAYEAWAASQQQEQS